MNLKTLIGTPPWEWPEDVDKIFLKALRDNQADESERLLAAEWAGDATVINDELADELLVIVSDDKESDSLRTRAAISLGPALEYAFIDGFKDPEGIPISENKFHEIQEALCKLYLDTDVPKKVRRRILEASVRAPQNWHPDAIREAHASADESWRLTAVFCMRFVRGFDEQILEALDTKNQDIHHEAVCAAGNWEVDAAWSHIAALITAQDTDKYLLMAAIEAVASIRPQEATEILLELTQSRDQDIAEAASEAMAMAGAFFDEEDEDDKSLH